MVAEAAIYILLARFALKRFPFFRLAAFFSKPTRKPELMGWKRRRARKMVKRAVFNAWRRFPLKNTCFHRAIAAHAMLRRRGVSTTLYYGAATLSGRGLTGHVWVRDGKDGVVGHHAAEGFHILARYPERNAMPDHAAHS